MLQAPVGFGATWCNEPTVIDIEIAFTDGQYRPIPDISSSSTRHDRPVASQKKRAAEVTITGLDRKSSDNRSQLSDSDSHHHHHLSQKDLMVQLLLETVSHTTKLAGKPGTVG